MATTKPAKDETKQAAQEQPAAPAVTEADVRKAMAAGRPLPPGVTVDFAAAEPIRIEGR